jgi:hypothetical protein
VIMSRGCTRDRAERLWTGSCREAVYGIEFRDCRVVGFISSGRVNIII